MDSVLNNTAFFKKIEDVYHLNMPFVVYRKPNETKIYGVCQQTSELHILKSFKACGFVFSPFDKNKSKIIFPFNVCNRISSIIENDFQVSKSDLKFKVEIDETIKNNYISTVQNAIDFINNDEAKKIVLSRKETITCQKVEVFNVLKKMLNSYKNAFVYLWFHPKVGLWMGATPERLISIDAQLNLKTMALAGTQKFAGTLQVKWKEKELFEQQYVTDYILENIGDKISEIQKKGPYTAKAGSLIHLRTDIYAKLKSLNLLQKLIDSLHPTPAICGIPKKVATDFILKNENYDRAFYSGYLGELNSDNTTNLYVNLRCMRLAKNNATLYIGGGIIDKSNAEKEWEETVAKAEIMKQVL
ncbi:isochorismate synthase [Lutibacter sp. A64]|uniref:isochorismate synthase n=1 Tax=Lutibacter sp. A64 TaxID=2918526 RepID=UPI001F0524CC|nr:isochorismate synthase [Lutibacter sp. A64]UMB54839.1 isochorismate synthase [Lutibacter sp. A64]